MADTAFQLLVGGGGGGIGAVRDQTGEGGAPGSGIPGGDIPGRRDPQRRGHMRVSMAAAAPRVMGASGKNEPKALLPTESPARYRVRMSSR